MSNGLHHQKSETEGKWNDSSPSSLLLFSPLYSVLSAIHQPVSPLARSLPSPLTLRLPLQTPVSARDLLLSGKRVPAVHYVQGSGGMRLQGKKCAADVNAAYGTQSVMGPEGVEVGRWGEGGVTMNIQ